MFSTITPIHGAERPRETENVDTRLAMYRRNADHQDKHGKKKHTQQSEIFGEDSTTVSTEALLAFLEDFIIARFGPTTLPAPKNNTTPRNQRIQKTGRTERAAKAYAHAAETSHYSKTPETVVQKDNASGDAQTIMALIKELKDLSKTNIKEIEISRKGSFLGSLAESIQNAKEELNPAS